jgi:hypothetical protein
MLVQNGISPPRKRDQLSYISLQNDYPQLTVIVEISLSFVRK